MRLDLRHDEVLSASHHAAPPVVTDTARDLPSDSLRTSQAPAVAHGAAGATISGSDSVDSSTVAIAGGTMVVLLGAAFAAAAANRRPPEAT